MLLYDKKNDSIDIYTIDAKIEELKNFRRNIIQKNRSDITFYTLSARTEEDIKFVLNSRQIICDGKVYSEDDINGRFSLAIDLYYSPIEEDIYEQYIDGAFASYLPIILNINSWKCDKRREKFDKRYLIKTNNYVSHSDIFKDWIVRKIMTLPKSLYLLQLLEQGRFEEPATEDISKQLELFDINFLKNVKLNDIKEMIETGIVNGTLDNAIYKAEIGSKILQKVIKK